MLFEEGKMKKLVSVPGFIILSLCAAGFITLAFFIGTWTASSGKVEVAGAFTTVPPSITDTAGYIEYTVSGPGTDANLAGVEVNFAITSRYLSLNPASGTVMTDSVGVARIEVTTKPDAPTWVRTAVVEASFSVGDLSFTSKTAPIPIDVG